MLVAGRMLLPDATIDAWVRIDGGKVVAWGKGEPEETPHLRGRICPPLVNAHTHCGDTFLRDKEKPSVLGELVGPGGWKHQQLARADAATMRAGMERFAREAAAVGTSHFIDFREGGVAGVKALRAAATDCTPFVMGRPLDATRMDEEEGLFEVVDGIGLSGMRDHRAKDLEAWAEACHERRRPFAVHVSEGRRDDIDAALALEPAFVVHMCQGTRRDFEQLAGADVPVVVCPRSNRFFGLPTPVHLMLEEGVTVAVGTDNGMLADADVRNESGLLGLDEETFLRMATWNGRRLLGLPPCLPPKKGQSEGILVLP